MLKKVLSNPKIGLIDVAAAIVILCSLVLLFFTDVNIPNLFTKEAVIEIGYLANGQDANNFYYIDNGKGKVTGIRNNGVEFALTSGSGANDFYQAEDLCINPADNSFYVLTVDWDSSGFLLASERILHYSATGKYIETVYTASYKPTDEINKHRIFDIRFSDGKLSFVRADDKKVSFCVVENGDVISEQSYDYPEAWVYFQNFAHEADGTIYGVEKRGHIIKFADNAQSVVYTSPKGSKEVLYDIDILNNGQLFFVDIYGGRICRVISDKLSYPIISSQILDGKATNGNGVQISNVYAKSDMLFTVYNDEIVAFKANGQVLSREGTFVNGKRLNLINWSYIAIFGLSLLCLGYLALRCICHVLVNKPKISIVAVSEISIVIFTLALSGSIIFGVSNPFQFNYLDHVTGQLKDMAISGANRFNYEWLNGIHNASDFMNEDYTAMSNLLHSMTTEGHDVDSRYGAEVNIIDADGRGYALCYTDNSIGTYYPMASSTYADVQKVYNTGKPLESEPTLAAGGTFLFGYAPIFDKDRKVVAVFSITQDNYRVMEAFGHIITDITISVMLVIIALIFFMNEGFSIIPQMREEKQLGVKFASIGNNPAPLSMLRIMSFTTAFVLNMTSSFLSVYTSSFWNETLGIPQAMAGAIPLFANRIFAASCALLCPTLHRKLGYRYLTMIGVILSTLGALLSGLSQSYSSICLALLLNGLGYGILLNSGFIALGMVEPADKRRIGFVGYSVAEDAGTNIGTIIGAFLAGFFAYYQVFFITSVLWGLHVFMFWRVGRQIVRPVEANIDTTQRGLTKNRIHFPFKAILFLLICTVPYAMIGKFASYSIPIIVNGLGYSPKYTSLLLVIRAVCIIALSKSLAGIMWAKLNKKAIIPAYLIALLGWLFIANSTDLRIMSVAMVLIGLSFAFGRNMIEWSFLDSILINGIGKDTALVLSKFSAAMGGSLSSIVFGFILASGLMLGMSVFAGICAVLLLLSFLLLRNN